MPTETKPEPVRQLFDVPGAMDYLKSLGADGVTINFVRTLMATDEIPHERIGKRFYTSKAALDAWVTRNFERRLK